MKKKLKIIGHKSCLDCLHCLCGCKRDGTIEIMECHYNPPSWAIGPDGEMISAWPKTDMNQWCTKWEARKDRYQNLLYSDEIKEGGDA